MNSNKNHIIDCINRRKKIKRTVETIGIYVALIAAITAACLLSTYLNS